MVKRVLLTGATGFVGRWCIEPLRARGFEVHATTTRPLSEARTTAAVHWHSVDLLQPGAAENLVESSRPTHLLHLAWYVEHGRFWDSAENLRWVEASLGLLRAFVESRGRRVVTAGTCAEYDWNAGDCSDTQAQLHPRTLYGTSKHALQMLTTAYAQQKGVSSAWGRIFFPFGPGEAGARLIPSVITSLLRGEMAQCSHGRQVRDFLYVLDLADAFAALLDSDVTGPVNLGSGTGIELRDVIYRIADILDARDRIALGSLAPVPQEPPRLVANVGRLREEVDWRPNHDLDTALRATIEWWRSKLPTGQTKSQQ